MNSWGEKWGIIHEIHETHGNGCVGVGKVGRAVRREPAEMNTLEVNIHKRGRLDKYSGLGGFTPSARRKNMEKGWRLVSAERNATF